MRKIEQQMVEAIKTQRNNATGKPVGDIQTWIQDNTQVRTSIREDGAIATSVYLHGNLIAQKSGALSDNWGFKMCGWNTPTTRSRINAIAGAFGHSGVCQRNGKPYSAGKEINSLDWF